MYIYIINYISTHIIICIYNIYIYIHIHIRGQNKAFLQIFPETSSVVLVTSYLWVSSCSPFKTS